MSATVLSPPPAKVYYEVVHHLPGRVRLRIPRLQYDDRYGRQLQALFVQEGSVQRIRLNLPAASLIIQYNPEANNPLHRFGQLIQAAADESLPPLAGLLPMDKLVYSPWNTNYFIEKMALPTLALAIVALLPVQTPFYPAIVATVIVVVALPTFQEALESLKHRHLNVTQLESLWTILHTLQGEYMAPVLATFMNQLGGALRDMTAQVGEKQVFDPFDQQRTYWVERGGARQNVSVRELQVGDRVIVAAGSAVPVDGTVLWGSAVIQRQFLTGESDLLPCEAEQTVLASSLVVRGQICVVAQAVGEETQVGKTLQLARQAPQLDTRIENYAEEISNQAILPAMGIAAIVYGATLDAHRAIAPLQLDFGSGIGITIPTAILAALTHAPQVGVYFRNGRALELLARVNVIVFDKTGTLTEVKGTIVGVNLLKPGLSEQTLLYWLATVEQSINHPFALAILEYAAERGIEGGTYSDWVYEPGKGVAATVEGQEILVGTPQLMRDRQVPIDLDELRTHEGVLWNRSLVCVACNSELVALVFYSNPVRSEAAGVIAALQQRDIECYMVTGDHHEVANAVGYATGFRPGQIYTNRLPEDKVALLEKFKNGGEKVVAYVGEGFNDTAAMAYADISITLADGSDAARQTADLVLMNSLEGLVQAIALSQEVMNIINQNIALVVIPNVSVVLAGVFLSLHPVIAVLISNGATLLAELNSLRILMDYRPVKIEGKPSRSRSQAGVLDIPWKKRPRRSFDHFGSKLSSPSLSNGHLPSDI
ncbi:MAG: cation-transporting ATPase-like protein [Thermosynechococcus sp.]|uniref:heavy metal translocating P-type ATPase n=1 Tax=Thermosynechococcus sp. TaxID=2814275 RepID=UPI0022084706|nr:heavy metal translocating P-type ATPase [Thermosynechococcus sp.]BCX11423.1 MAG: cation-transporting ATPase-like protein [Thermosynechococcus sp.]